VGASVADDSAAAAATATATAIATATLPSSSNSGGVVNNIMHTGYFAFAVLIGCMVI